MTVRGAFLVVIAAIATTSGCDSAKPPTDSAPPVNAVASPTAPIAPPVLSNEVPGATPRSVSPIGRYDLESVERKPPAPTGTGTQSP
jgi:hypothetical protein